MDKAVDMWLGIFTLCGGLPVVGSLLANLLNCKAAGYVSAGLAMIGVTFGAVLFGAVGILHSLEGCEVRHIRDGREEIIIELRLGPFSYRRSLPFIEEHN